MLKYLALIAEPDLQVWGLHFGSPPIWQQHQNCPCLHPILRVGVRANLIPPEAFIWCIIITCQWQVERRMQTCVSVVDRKCWGIVHSASWRACPCWLSRYSRLLFPLQHTQSISVICYTRAFTLLSLTSLDGPTLCARHAFSPGQNGKKHLLDLRETFSLKISVFL